jgi:hypothetical protein
LHCCGYKPRGNPSWTKMRAGEFEHETGFVMICVFTCAFVICNWEGGRASPLCFYFLCGIGWVTKLLSLIISLVFVYSSCNIPFLCRLWNVPSRVQSKEVRLDRGFVVGFCRAAGLPGDYGANCVQNEIVI